MSSSIKERTFSIKVYEGEEEDDLRYGSGSKLQTRRAQRRRTEHFSARWLKPPQEKHRPCAKCKSASEGERRKKQSNVSQETATRRTGANREDSLKNETVWYWWKTMTTND